ncbi:MAG: FkbM family methyltransferase [Segetibacter sp.]
MIWGAHPPRFILKNYGINHIFDVGANKGQFAQQVRASGYNGKIVSFEPIRSVFEILKQNADKDPLWTALNYGCGDYDGEAIINVSEHSVFSSMLEQLPLLKGNYKKPNYVRKEEIKVCKIDSIFNKYYKEDEKVLLKIDTQGFEKKF